MGGCPAGWECEGATAGVPVVRPCTAMARPARTSRRPPPAADLVRRWLAEQQRTQEWLAGALGVSPAAVVAWLSGRQWPILETAAVLERLTEGAVAASAWADPVVVRDRHAAALAHEPSRA